MSDKTPDRSRRRFLAHAGQAAVATAAVAAPAMALQPKKSRESPTARQQKHAIPGSPNPAYSRAVQFGQLVFVAGCVGRYEKAGEQTIDKEFESQAAQTLMNLKASVEAAGSSMDRVLKCTCFLKKQEHFGKFSEVYTKFFPEPRPARSTVVVADFVVTGALLEVDCICYVD